MLTWKIMIAVMSGLMAVHIHTHVYSNQRVTIVVRDHTAVVAAFADGWLCYESDGTVGCHKAIPRPTYKEIK